MQNISFTDVCHNKEEVREMIEHLLSQMDVFYSQIWGKITISYCHGGLSHHESPPKDDTRKKSKS